MEHLGIATVREAVAAQCSPHARSSNYSRATPWCTSTSSLLSLPGGLATESAPIRAAQQRRMVEQKRGKRNGSSSTPHLCQQEARRQSSSNCPFTECCNFEVSALLIQTPTCPCTKHSCAFKIPSERGTSSGIWTATVSLLCRIYFLHMVRSSWQRRGK